MIIDSHHHLWDPARAYYEWMTDEVASLRRPIGLDDLRAVLTEAGVDASVVVQARHDTAETFELLEACEHWRTCTGGVSQPLVGEALAAWGYERSISEQAPFAQMGPDQEPVTMRRGSMAGSGSSRDRR